MTEPRSGGVKTLAIRLPDELHAQLALIAQLDGISLTDAIRQAIEGLIERKRAEGDLAAQAAQALEEIERESAARREAIQSLLGQTGETEAPKRRRGNEPPTCSSSGEEGRYPRPSSPPLQASINLPKWRPKYGWRSCRKYVDPWSTMGHRITGKERRVEPEWRRQALMRTASWVATSAGCAPAVA